MLEFLRRSATSVFAWLILGILALVFGLSFGLPSDSIKIGSDAYVTVNGEPIKGSDYQYQYAVAKSFMPLPKDEKMAEMMGVKQEVLEAIVERHVLSDVGEKMGLGATVWDAETLTIAGQMIFFGDTVDWLGDTKFNYDIFTKRFLRTLQISEKNYLEVQRREILARTVRDLIASSVVVSEGELRAAYDEEANQLSLRYVRFEPSSYAQLVDPTTDEVAAYVESHTEELDKAFESQGSRFTKLGKQARVRILKVDAPADDPEKAAAARTTIAAARKRITKGTDFRTVAREVSTDTATARRGGEYGWASIEGTGSGLDPKVDEAAQSLEDGQVSPIVEGDGALYLVQVTGRREGDVPKEQAVLELAEEAIKDEKGKELAKRAADEALSAIKSGKTMADLFQSPDALPAPGEAIEAIEAAPAAPAVRPEVQTTGLFRKGATIPGLGANPELTAAAWEADPKAEAIEQVFEAGTGFVIAGIDRRDSATDEGFAERRGALYDQLVKAKAGRTAATWAMRECMEAKAKGQLVVAEAKVKSLVTYDRKDGEANPGFKPYSVCERVGNRGGMLKFGMFAQQPGGGAR